MLHFTFLFPFIFPVSTGFFVVFLSVYFQFVWLFVLGQQLKPHFIEWNRKQTATCQTHCDYVIHFIFRWSEKRALLQYYITLQHQNPTLGRGHSSWICVKLLETVLSVAIIKLNQTRTHQWIFLWLNKRWSMDQSNYLISYTQNDATVCMFCVRNKKKIVVEHHGSKIDVNGHWNICIFLWPCIH